MRRRSGRIGKLLRNMRYKIKIEFVNGAISLENKVNIDYWIIEVEGLNSRK